MTKNEEVQRLKCEKMVNTTWTDMAKHRDKLEIILKKENLTEDEISLLKMIGYAFLQKLTLNDVDDLILFDKEYDP